MRCLGYFRYRTGKTFLMPTYQYRCPADLTMLEMHQSFEDNLIPNCSVCGQQMSKVFQATPAVFRGDGWAGKK